MTKYIYSADSLTDGSGALDYIDGDILVDGDGAFVFDSTALIFSTYVLDEDIGGAEDLPYKIAPYTNPGNKRWILSPIQTTSIKNDDTEIILNDVDSTSSDIQFNIEGTKKVTIDDDGIHTFSGYFGQNGSLSSPTFTFEDSPTSGLYSPDTNEVSIVTNSTRRIHINDEGKVGIGKDAPSAPYALDVEGSFRSTDIFTDEVTVTDIYSSTIDLTGEVWTGDGTEAAPSISFSNDAATGLYLEGASTLSFSTGSSRAMHIDSDQIVHFDNTPTVDGAEILTSDSTTFLDASLWTQGTGNKIYYENSGGSVGIGTDDPNTNLHIYNDTLASIRLEPYGATQNSYIYMSGTVTSFSMGLDTSNWFRATFSGNGISMSPSNYFIGLGQEDDPDTALHIKSSLNDNPTITLEGTNGNSSYTGTTFYKNSISPEDQDGIGLVSFYANNDSAEKTLFGQIFGLCQDVGDGEESFRYFIQGMAKGTNRNFMQITGNNAATPGDGKTSFNSSGADFDFAIEADGGAEVFFVQGSDGYIGINDNTPSYQLDVDGDINVTGTFRVDGSPLELSSSTISMNDTGIEIVDDGTAVSYIQFDIDSTTKVTIDIDGIHTFSGYHAQNGLASSPTFTFEDSKQSGLFSPETNQVAIATDGVQALMIDSSQRVGIGTTPSASHVLTVNGNTNLNGNVSCSSIDCDNLTISGIIDSTSMATWTLSGDDIYYNDGNVGINNDSPNSALDIDGSINCTGDISFDGSLNGTIDADTLNGLDSTAFVRVDGSTNIVGDLVISDGSKIGIGTTPTSHVDIVDGFGTSINIEATDADSEARLYLKNDAITWTTKVTSDDEYKIGMGATDALVFQPIERRTGIFESDPDTSLHITSYVSGEPVITLEGTIADATFPGIDFYKNSSTPADQDGIGKIRYLSNNDSSDKTMFGQVIGLCQDAGDGEESFRYLIQGMAKGAVSSFMQLTGHESSEAGDGTIEFSHQTRDFDFIVNSYGVADALFVQGSDGFVGINNNTPSYRLDVNGDINCTGDLRIDGVSIDSTSINLWSIDGDDIYYNDGNIGIGTSTPSSYEVSANNLVIYEAGNGGLTIAGGTSNSGAIQFADGTTGNEAYRGYITYQHSNDSMSLGTSGTTQVKIDIDGNVGINNASPSTTLDVGGPGYFSGDVTVGGNLTVDGTAFIVNSAIVEIEDNTIVLNYGETGTGVTAGVSGLEIDRGTLDNFFIQFRESDDACVIGVAGSLQAMATREDSPNNTAVAFWNDTAKRFDTSTGFIYDNVNNYVGIGTTTPSSYNDAANNLVIYEAGNAGITIAGGTGDSGGLYFADGTSGADAYRGFVSYNHSNDKMGLGASASSLITLDGVNRYVGIGTATPQQILEIERDQNALTQVQIDNNTAGTAAGSQIRISSNTCSGRIRALSGTYESSGYNIPDSVVLEAENCANGLSIVTDASSPIKFWTSSSEAMRIDSAGYVGINETSPQYELHVNGDIFFTGSLITDGFEIGSNENLDVDTGTETVDEFSDSTANNACVWHYVVKKDNNLRAGTVTSCWYDGGTPEYSETKTSDIGDTSDVTLAVDNSGGNVRLRATTTSDDWEVRVIRNLF